jgi:hypothetical protein
MKMINFGFSFASINLIILLTFINLQTGHCGTGGGQPLTPYKNDKEITEEKIKTFKEKSNYNRIGVLSDSFISADYFMLHRIREAKALVDESDDKDKPKFHKEFFGCCLAFVYMPNQNDCEYTEKLDDTFDDFKFEKLSVKKIKYDYEKKELHLKGWLTEKELDILEDEIYKIGGVDKSIKRKIRLKVRKLFIKSRIRDNAYFHIEGTLLNSEKKIKIHLGDIDKIKFLRFDKEIYSALLEIVVLPKISPKNLLSIQPTYSYLKAHHTETVKIWVDCKNKNGEELFIGEIINCDKWPKTCFPSDLGEFDKRGKFSIKNEQKVADITENMELVLGFINNDIWWAIPSVIKDDDYPYWVIFAE